MEKFFQILMKFLDEEDARVLKSISSDSVLAHSIKKIFEKPENSAKYLIFLKDNPNGVYLVAKAADRLSRYLDGKDSEVVFGVFFSALKLLRDSGDKKTIQGLFSLLREAIEYRLANGRYEDAARLAVEFQDFGLKNYIKKILFFVFEVVENGDYLRAMRILDMLPKSEDILDVKASILLEWGKKLSLSIPEAGIKKIEESLSIRETEEAKLALAEVYENIGEYKKALSIYYSMKNYPGVAEKIARLLMEWGEIEKDLDKLYEAKNLTSNDLLREEIERRIIKIKTANFHRHENFYV